MRESEIDNTVKSQFSKHNFPARLILVVILDVISGRLDLELILEVMLCIYEIS